MEIWRRLAIMLLRTLKNVGIHDDDISQGKIYKLIRQCRLCPNQIFHRKTDGITTKNRPISFTKK